MTHFRAGKLKPVNPDNFAFMITFFTLSDDTKFVRCRYVIKSLSFFFVDQLNFGWYRGSVAMYIPVIYVTCTDDGCNKQETHSPPQHLFLIH